MSREELLKLVMESFEAERTSDSEKGLSLLHEDFAVTEMNLKLDGEEPFRRETGEALRASVAEVYQISDREYQFMHAMADEQTQTVMVEFVESYTDDATGKRYRTPQVAVCEIKDGKIWRTRHYLDIRLPYQFPSQEQIDEAFS